VDVSYVNAAGANGNVPVALGASCCDEYVDKDGDSGNSNCSRDLACLSEEPRNRMVCAQWTG
jgi:hypothetical protein